MLPLKTVISSHTSGTEGPTGILLQESVWLLEMKKGSSILGLRRWVGGGGEAQGGGEEGAEERTGGAGGGRGWAAWEVGQISHF